MSLKKITGQRVVDELKAGHTVFVLQQVDMTHLTIADWLTEEFAVEEQLADSPLPDPIQEKQPTKRRKLDYWGKIQALYQAGWSHEKIADEMGTTAGTVVVGLSKLRKKEDLDGKEKTEKAYPGAEGADQQGRARAGALAGLGGGQPLFDDRQ